MASKLMLSAAESDLIKNADWFLTKQNITSKITAMFGRLLEEFKKISDSNSELNAVMTKSPKIFKGENYRGIPWIMLDFPRIFGSEDVFAIRTMFWWGNYFSVTLHLKGVYKMQLLQSKSFSLQKLKEDEFYVASSVSEFEHAVDKVNYLDCREITESEFSTLIYEQNFFKLAKTIPLTEWHNAEEKIREIYEQILSLFEI